MKGVVKDVQKASFRKLVTETIPKIITDTKVDFGDYVLEFKPMTVSNSVLLTDQAGTDYNSIKTECTLKMKGTGESVEFNVELLRVPVLHELGFKIKGNYMQQLDVYERATGWNFYQDKRLGECASLIAENGRSIYFYQSQQGPCVRFRLHGENTKSKIRLSTFLRVLLGCSNDEIISMFGYNNPYVIEAFGAKADNRNLDECIKELACAVLNDNNCVTNRTVLNLKDEIETDLLSARYFPLGKSNLSRLKYFQSFSSRANGRSLAKDVDCNGYHFDKGTVLSTEELRIIDKLPIRELYVSYNQKVYCLHKFSSLSFDVLGAKSGMNVEELGIKKGQIFSEADIASLENSDLTSITLADGKVVVRRKNTLALNADDVLTAFGIWVDNLNGFEQHSKQFEITNRVLQSYDKVIEGMIVDSLNKVINNIKKNLHSMDFSGQLAICVNNCFDGINVNAFIDKISNASNNSGQMSDMCNLMAYVAKSGKAAANLGKASATDEMVNVQDLQEGRLDPLDVPESDKIGSVHYRTLLSKLDEDGNPMAPFIKVRNGEVVSKEPVYLTAVEQTDLYVAEWNETFKNEDGSKKDRVRVLCNGDVFTVETDRVFYKEYSPYQNLSAAHSMVPFPGHSAGKRITMACNQVKQAVPCVNKQRPRSASGGESILSIGYYTANDVLESYWEKTGHLLSLSKEEVLQSSLHLRDIITKDDTRTFNFTVDAVEGEYNTASLTVPYLLRTFEASMFSYNINPVKGNVYRGDDVVAVNNGYSLETKKLMKCADFGAQSVDDAVFNKGIALTQNLHVVYKTYGGSAIEDGILISSKLVHDDTLTHIGLFEIKEVATKGNDKTEHFAILRDTAPEYLCSNGLPKKGTYLKPGMVAISKIRENGKKVSAKSVYVPTYVEGQVISTKLETTLKGTEATVVIAQRSYVQSGDKLAGRCGNKGVIARIVPETEMPFIEDTGMVADVVLNPLGIPSRQNITQLLEALISFCAEEEDSIALVTPYNPNDVDFVRKIGEEHDAGPKVLVDGRTGLRFPRKINFGVLPMYKLHHVSKRKIHAVGMDAKIDSTFLQPTKGSKQNGGQSFGEMETWCLEAAGATTLLNELFTLQSDDIVSKDELIGAQNSGGSGNDIETNNSNDLAMQACYRSMFVEFSTDTVNGEYTFEPLRDTVIRALFPTPITTKSMLHAENIFGLSSSLTAKAEGRDKWGWINLHCEIIPPLWVYKGNLSRVVGISLADMRKIIQCELYVKFAKGTEDEEEDEDGFESQKRVAPFTKVKLCTEEELKLYRDNGCSEEELAEWSTGMPALVYVFKNLDTYAREKVARDALEEFMAKYPNRRNSSTESGLRSVYRALSDFNKSGYTLSDYVVTSMPVMPQTYRPRVQVAGRNVVPDFDWHYTQILNAANDVDGNCNAVTVRDLFNAILEFTGLDEKRKNKTYKSLLTFFCAKGQKNHHGKIRENIQSKRILCSGRCAIKPAEDITRTPLEIGVPFTMMVKMYSEKLYGYFLPLANGVAVDKKAFKNLMLYLSLRDKKRFDELYERCFSKIFVSNIPISEGNSMYNVFTVLVKNFLEGKEGNAITAVGAGRQPSLHKYSVRAFRPYVVYDNVAHLHPLLCKGYNADFDGDQMYFFAILTDTAVQEALDKLSPAKDFILSKNGSVVLEHSQDIVLGVYAATMLKDNVEQLEDATPVAVYSSLDSMRTDFYTGIRNLWDVVVYVDRKGRRYLSTVGRILFNSLIPDGFTDEPFTNCIGAKGIKCENYRELRYDGIVGNGKGGGSQSLRYYSLSGLCNDVYDKFPNLCIDVYQAITEFGFIASDRMAVSLSLYDFDIESDKDAIISEAEKLKARVESDYQYGLISSKDKRDAIIAIYGDPSTGANTKIINDLLKHLPRNNNIFIMMDSGARGNKSQLMQMKGAVGILQKTKTEDLETSVIRNFYEGLNSFDVHLASYSARTGVAATQNETKRSGYATHKVVYMASGIQIVESDCGQRDQKFAIEWDEHDSSKDRFMPTYEWFEKHLLGKVVDVQDGESAAIADRNGCITAESFDKLKALNGFHEIKFKEGSIVADVFRAKGAHAFDEESRRYLKNVSKGYVLTVQNINLLLKKHLGTIETDEGVYTIRYKMSSSCKSLMVKRVATNLPHLAEARDEETGEVFGIVTDDTVKFIEDNKLDSINMRTTLRCRSKHGICAHCYGLQFSNKKFPKVGTFVGTDSAQSIAEPASQLTLDVINKGGAAGSSGVTSGVQVFDDLLSGSKQDNRMTAIISDTTGYARITKMDNLATVCIIPENRECTKCANCMQQDRCPLEEDITNRKIACMLPSRIPFNQIILKDGEYVKAGDKITNDMVHPDMIVKVEGCNSELELHVHKQRVWINNYYNIFKNSGISVYARHFELIANVQNRYVMIKDGGDTDFDAGEVYEFNEVLPVLDRVKMIQYVSKRNDVVLRNSGAFAALAFENVSSVAASLVTSGYRESYKHNHSLISSLSVGENLKNPGIKTFNAPAALTVVERDTDFTAPREIVSLLTEVKDDVEETFSLDGINLEALTASLNAFDSSEPQSSVSNSVETKKIASFEEDFDSDEFIPSDAEQEEDDFAEEMSTADENSEQIGENTNSYNNLKGNKVDAF